MDGRCGSVGGKILYHGVLFLSFRLSFDELYCVYCLFSSIFDLRVFFLICLSLLTLNGGRIDLERKKREKESKRVRCQEPRGMRAGRLACRQQLPTNEMCGQSGRFPTRAKFTVHRKKLMRSCLLLTLLPIILLMDPELKIPIRTWDSDILSFRYLLPGGRRC
jgi:hypothetical protein